MIELIERLNRLIEQLEYSDGVLTSVYGDEAISVIREVIEVLEDLEE